MDLSNLFPQAPSYISGLLGEDEADRLRRQAQQSGLLNIGLSLLAGAGPQPQRTGIGQLLAQGVMAGQQASRNAYEQAVKDKMMQQQIEEQRQLKAEQQIAQGLLPQILRPGQEQYGEDIMGQRVGVGVGQPQLDLNTLQQLLTRAPSVAAKVMPTIEAFQKYTKPETFELTEGQRRFQRDPITGEVKEIAAGGVKEEKPAGAVLEAMQVLGITKPIAQLSPPERKQIGDYIDRKEAQKSPKVSVDLKDPTAVNQAQLKTMNQWEGYLKDSGDAVVANRASAFYDAFRQATQEGNVAADGAMLYNVAKIYDPTGAVLASDIGTIVGNRSIPSQIQLLAQKVQKGGTLLPQERQNLKKIVDGIVTERGNALESVLEQYQNVNKQLGGSPGAIRNPYATVRRPRKSLDELTGGQ
jgi:phosphotransferase system IIB component